MDCRTVDVSVNYYSLIAKKRGIYFFSSHLPFIFATLI